MLRLRIATEIELEKPSVDVGFVSWLGIEIVESRLAGGDTVIGTARVALIHVGAVCNARESLDDVLDADSADLEALSHWLFEDNWIREGLVETANGSDVLYLADFELRDATEVYTNRVGITLVRRLCDTLGAGVAAAVVPVCDGEPTQPWTTAGFTIAKPVGNDACGYLLLDTSLAAPESDDDQPEAEQAQAAPAWTRAPKESGELRLEFENSHGERWFVSATKARFRLTGADISWRTIELLQPDYRALGERLLMDAIPAPHFEGVVLNREEQLWLAAALMTAQAR
jgi:hypothetical protein